MLRHFDVCVVGGGPSGLSAAYTLACSNMSVALIMNQKPRSINAGETLHPSALDSIMKMQLLSEFEKLDFKKIAGFESSWGNSHPKFKSSIQMPAGAGWLFQRTAFEDMILKQFEIKGGLVLIGDFKIENRNKWHLTSEVAEITVEISASFLVIATGRNHLNNLSFSPRHALDKLICYTIQACCEDDDMTVKLDALEAGWLYTVKNHNGFRVISFFTDGDLFKEKNPSVIARQLTSLIRSAPSVSKIAKNTDGLLNNSITVSSANTTFIEKAYGDRWLACGDYAQTFDPLCSQGISYALSSGIEAGNSIIEFLSGLNNTLQFYELSRRTQFHEYLKLRKAYYNMEKRWNSTKFWSRRNGAMPS